MKKVLFVLAGVFVANVIYKFSFEDSNHPLTKHISNNVKELLKANSMNDSEEQQQADNNEPLKAPNQLGSKDATNAEAKSETSDKIEQVTNLKLKKSKSLNNDELDKELDEYFGEGEALAEEDSELGSAYRAEVRLEARKLQKKLIQQ